MPQSAIRNPKSAIPTSAILSAIAWSLALVFVPFLFAAEPAKLSPEHAAKMKRGLAVFQKHVRPVLVAQCVKCHGGEKVKSGLNMATRAGLIKGGDLEPGIVVGKSKESYLIKVLSHAEEPFMPAGGKKLPDTVVARIAEWIDLGAPYDKPLIEQANGPRPAVITEEDRNFWSFRPLAAVEPPAVQQADWVRTPIDQFILAAQEKQGLRPNPPAERRKLIRRAYFSLLGLPPTPEQVERFVNDTDPQAYEKLINTLLESPHYGERWARHWMDVARFAESHGYEQDYDRPHAYHYRDFLIRALNDDMPYDQFVRWQLAGDEIAPEDPWAKMATGFLGAGAFPTQLTEVEFESARYDELDDMVGTTSTAILGLTVGCARCHNHKYDPIPNRDYYRLVATFATTIRSEVELDMTSLGDRQRLAVHRAQQATLQQELARYEQQELPARLKTWLANHDLESAAAGDGWTVVALKSYQSTGGTKYALQPDGSLLATGKPPAKEDVTLVFETADAGITALRLEALTHGSLPHKGPGRAGNGNFALGDFQVEALPIDGSAKPAPVKLADARATHQQDAGSLSVKASIDGNPVSGWAVDRGGIGKDQAAVFEFAEPTGAAGGTRFTVTLRFQHPNTKHSLGRFRISTTQAARPVSIDAPALPPAEVRQGLAALQQDWNGNQKHLPAVLAWFGRRHDAGWQQRQANIAAHAKDRPQPRVVKAQITSEGVKPMKHHADGRGFPHFYPRTYFLERGDVKQKKGPATAGFLQVLLRDDEANWQVESPSGDTSGRRTALANWLTDADRGAGHLAARVIVNRMWHHHFGSGMVGTPSDFGFQGDRPTHPELLDWLAGQLIENGWKRKPIHRLILRSAVYRQNSDYDETRANIDRENRWLWRRAPQRLEAEAIRDSMLAVSGLLDGTRYGPGTLDENMRRRSIYFFIKRSKLIPTMMLFDWPEHLVGIGRRANTTIAPQALAFMNSPQTRRYAEGLARRVVPAPDRPLAQSVRSAYLIALSRPAADAEVRQAEQFINTQAQRYREGGKGDGEHLALVDFCQTLMSLNEFVYID